MIFPNYIYILFPLFLTFFVLDALGSSAFPLVMSFLLAYLSFPVITKLEDKRISRKVATVFIFALIFTIIIVALIITLPIVYNEILQFIKEIPGHVKTVIFKLDEFLIAQGIEVKMDKAQLIEHVRILTAKIPMETFGKITGIFSQSFSGIASFFSGVINMFLFPIFYYFIIVNYENISKNMNSLVPRSIRRSLRAYFDKINEIFSGFFRGQFLVCLVQAFIYGIGLHFTGLKHGLLIGFVTGLLCFIPFVGFSLGAVTAFIVGFANFDGWGTITGVAVVFSVGQIIESIYLTPKFVGGKVGLHPLTSLIALLVGGSAGGLLGMFLAIPLGAIVVLTLQVLVSSYKKSTIYLRK
ncbi:MAG: AI-2E family transporter [Deltaproteobacteria bacterium]|nr:MAG: AI-2E family transporter [Deltaproteobacteria bacterium]